MNIFQQLWKSLYSPKTIALFRFQGIGKTIAYLFLLMLISSLPFIIQFGLLATNSLSAFKAAVTEDLPPFTIENGELSSPIAKIKQIQRGSTAIIFDPVGEMSARDVAKHKQAIGLLKKGLVLSVGGQAQEISYDFFGTKTVTQENASGYMQTLQTYLAIILPVLFVMYYLFTSFLGFVKASIAAGLGMLFKALTGRKLFYRQSWRLAVYAMTPAVILFAALRLTGERFPASFLGDWLLTGFMLFLAVRSIPLPKAKSPSAVK